MYGGNEKVPFEDTDAVDKPVSLYDATNESNELMAHTYNHLHLVPTTGLRFLQFTVRTGVRTWRISASGPNNLRASRCTYTISGFR